MPLGILSLMQYIQAWAQLQEYTHPDTPEYTQTTCYAGSIQDYSVAQ